MKIKPNSKITKILSVVLSLVMLLGTFPIGSTTSFAAGENLTIQYLINGVVQEGMSLGLKTDENADEIISGTTDKKGVWETTVTWTELAQIFVVYVNGDAKIIEKSDEGKNWLIIDQDERTWSDKAASLESVTISVDKNNVFRGDSVSFVATVKGTPDSYQWYHKGQEINGATSNVYNISSADLDDSGNYECRVKDSDGNTRTSNSVSVTVTEATLSGVSLKAYSNGTEIAGSVNRDTVEKIELKVAGLPSDADVAAVKFYVNDNCDNHSNTDLSYVFDVENGVETYNCKVVLTFNKKYAETTINLSAPIQLDMMAQAPVSVEMSEEVVFDDNSQIYSVTYSASPKTTFDVTVSGGSGSGEYSLVITNEQAAGGLNSRGVGSVATATRNGNENKWTVKINGAGTFDIEVGKAGDNVYSDAATVTKSVVVNKASAEGFEFVNKAPEAMVYNTNNNEFTNVVEGFENVKYSVESGDCATIDESTGKLTVLKAGTVMVKATMPESKNYQEATATYTLTVNKASQTIQFEEKADTIYYGQTYTRVAAPVSVEEAADGYGYNHDENAKIIYSIILAEGQEEVATDVNEDGSLVFASGKTGVVTIKAELAGNDCYEAATAEYTLTVGEYSVENGFSINGPKVSADNEWYIDDVKIVPIEGYLISKNNNLDDSNIWLESIEITQEGKGNGCNVYLKNIETGAISRAYNIANEKLMLDKQAPEGLKINYRTSAWYEAVLDTVTLGYYNSAVTFVLEAKDDVSGISSFVWSFEDEENSGNSVEETTVEAIEKDGIYQSVDCVLGDENDLQELRGKFSFKAVDNAGNEEKFESAYVIVVDNADAELSISTDVAADAVVNNEYPYTAADENSVEILEIYSEDVTVTFSIIEKNFFPERVAVKVNGEDVTNELSWSSSGDNHIATIKLDENGDYAILLSYQSIFGADPEHPEEKDTYETEKLISIDKDSPVITVSLDKASFEKDNVKYYNNDVKAVVSVKEAKFRPSDLTIGTVEGYKGLTEENIQHLKNSENWSYDEESGLYTASVIVKAQDADGDYRFTVDYTDIAGNSAEQVESETFVIDTILPELNVSNNESVQNTVTNSYPYNNATEETANSIEIYNSDTTAVFTIKEKNFFADRAVITVNGDPVTNVTWSISADVHTAEISFDENGDYNIVVKYTDIFEGSADSTEKAEYTASKSICVDKAAPVIEISLGEDEKEYYNSDVTVWVSVKETKFRPSELVISDVDGFTGLDAEDKEYLLNSENWTYNAEKSAYETSFAVETKSASCDYKFALDYTDLANNSAKQSVSEHFVIDANKPVINANYGEASILDSENNVISSFEISETDNVVIFDTETVTVTFTVNEENFSSENAKVYISENGEEFKESAFDNAWVSQGNTHTNTVTLDNQGSYRLKLAVTDLCTNVSDEFSSPKVIIDDTVPAITYKIDAEGTYYYDDEFIDVTINVFDDRFNAGRMTLEIDTRTLDGDEISLEDTIPDIKNADNWIEGTNESGTVYHSFKITFSTQAVYKLTTTYTDAVGGENISDYEFVIDRTGPENLKIEYSVPKLYKILSAITFNYYNAPVTITLTAEDDISGVKKMDWKYTREAGASEINLESSEGSYEYDVAVSHGEYVVTIPVKSDDGVVTLADLEQLRGNISLVVTDATGNVSKFGNDNENSDGNGTDFNKTIIVDTISPTRKVEFSAPTVEANNKLYYDHSAVATVTITEANFYAEDVVLTINNVVKSNLEWVQNGDSWTTSITLSDDGNYVIGIAYTDRSSNQMEEYTSKEIVVDTTSPVITTDIKDEMEVANNGAAFFVKDANFDASKLVLKITAEDIGGIPVDVPSEFEDYLKDNKNWTTEDNLNYKIIISSLPEEYGLHSLEDGIYVMTVSGTDFVGNASNVCTTPKNIASKRSPEHFNRPCVRAVGNPLQKQKFSK